MSETILYCVIFKEGMMKLRFFTASYVINATGLTYQFKATRWWLIVFCAAPTNPIVLCLAGYPRHNEWMLEATAPNILLAYFLIMNYQVAFNKDREECFEIN